MVPNQHSGQELDLANVEKGLRGCDAVFPHDEYRAYQGLRDWASLLVADRARLVEQLEAAHDILQRLLTGHLVGPRMSEEIRSTLGMAEITQSYDSNPATRPT